jgi:Bacterial type II and III secretion system protein
MTLCVGACWQGCWFWLGNGELVAPPPPTPSREGRGRISSRRSGDGDGAHAVDVGLGGRAETTVELGSGQSFAIAGLLQKTTVDQTNALPGIGEMPVIGALFKSNNFQRGGVGADHHCHAVSGAAGA